MIITFLSGFLLISCYFEYKTESNLSEEDLIFISNIIPLEEGEKIIMFETNGGFNGLKTSGNFITNKQIASYWIDGKNDRIDSIKYKDIDSLKIVDRTRTLTYSSYIQLYSSKQNDFKVYVGTDSIRIKNFLNKTVENWNN